MDIFTVTIIYALISSFYKKQTLITASVPSIHTFHVWGGMRGFDCWGDLIWIHHKVGQRPVFDEQDRIQHFIAANPQLERFKLMFNRGNKFAQTAQKKNGSTILRCISFEQSGKIKGKSHQDNAFRCNTCLLCRR